MPKAPKHIGGIGALPPVVGLPAHQEEAIHREWDSYDRVYGELIALGITFPEAPKEARITLTERALSTEHNDEITMMTARANAWFGYLKSLYAQIRSQLLQRENEKDFLTSETRSQIRKDIKDGIAPKLSKEEVEDEVNLNPRIRTLTLEMQALMQKKMMVESLMDTEERNIRVLSRQVEVNRQELESESIKNNIQSRPGTGPGRGDFRR